MNWFTRREPEWSTNSFTRREREWNPNSFTRRAGSKVRIHSRDKRGSRIEFIHKRSAGKSTLDSLSSRMCPQQGLEETKRLNLPHIESSDSFIRSRASPMSNVHSSFDFRAVLEEEFNPHRIPCMYNVMVSTDTVEIVFFHTEGMARLFGVGLPFSKVSIRPKLKIVVEDVSEQEWRKFWMEPYEGSFKPLILMKSKNSGVTGKGSTESTEAVPDSVGSGVGLEGRSTCEAENVRPSTDDESESQTLKFKGGWMGWVDELLTERKELNKNIGKQQDAQGRDYIRRLWSRRSRSKNIVAAGESSTKEMSAGDCGSSGESGTHSTSEGPRITNVVAKKEHVRNATVKNLQVDVEISGRLCKLYEKVGQTQKLQEVQGSDIPGTCSIQPSLSIEFLCDQNVCGEFSKGSKRLNVTFNTTYQFEKFDIDGHPPEFDVDNIFKSGWYHDNLFFSFNCSESDAAKRDISSQEIVSKRITAELETMTNTQNSEYRSTAINRDGNLMVGCQPFARAGLKLGNKEQSMKGVASLSQARQILNVQVLAEAPSFYINSFCTEQKMAYRASLLRDPQHSMWQEDGVECSRNKEGGMLSTVSTQVKGSWRLLGDSNVIHHFTAQRELRHHELSIIKPVQENTNTKFLKCNRFARLQESTKITSMKFKNFARLSKKRSKKYGRKINDHTILQKVSYDFTVNHSFSHLLELGIDSPDISWDMERPLEA